MAREGSSHKLVFQVDDLAKARDAVVAQGATALELPGAASEPAVRLDFTDPEGNVFQLALS